MYSPFSQPIRSWGIGEKGGKRTGRGGGGGGGGRGGGGGKGEEEEAKDQTEGEEAGDMAHRHRTTFLLFLLLGDLDEGMHWKGEQVRPSTWILTHRQHIAQVLQNNSYHENEGGNRVSG